MNTSFIIAHIEYYRDWLIIGKEYDFLERNVEKELKYWIKELNKNTIFEKYKNYDSLMQNVYDVRIQIRNFLLNSFSTIDEIRLMLDHIEIRDTTKDMIYMMIINNDTKTFYI